MRWTSSSTRGAFDGWLRVFDANGSPITAVNNTGFCQDEHLTTSCLEPGVYYIFVAPTFFFGTPVTSYALTVNCMSCTPAIGCDNEFGGGIGYDGAPDFQIIAFNNTHPPHAVVTFSLCYSFPSYPQWDSYLEIYDTYPTGSTFPLFADNDGCGTPGGHASLTAVLPHQGLYHALVKGRTIQDTGDFWL